MGVLSELTVRFSADVSGAKSNIASLSGAVVQASSTFKSLGDAGNLSKAVTGEDVAAAKLTLLESKATEARIHLRELEDAVDAGKIVLGIDQARAQVTILEGKAQDARTKLQAMGNEGADDGPKMASAFERVTSTLQGMSSGVEQVGSNIKSMAGSFVGNIGNMIGGAIDFVGKIGLAINGVQGMYSTVIGLGHAFLDSNASMEQTTVAFKQLLGSSSAANKELKSLATMAADTPFEFPDLANSVQKLLAFQIPLKSTHPLLLAIGDALSGLGKNTPATLDQVVNVFGQMNAAGKIQTQDLMQLTSVGINGFQLLADQMHKPVSVIKDMVTSGTIPATKGIEMLRAGMEKTFGGGMAAQAQTFNGLLSTFQDNAGAAWRAFTGPLFVMAKSGLTDIGNLVSSPKFQEFATTMGTQVGGALKSVGSFIQTSIIPTFQHLVEAFKSPEFQMMQSAFTGLGVTLSQVLLPVLQPLIDKFKAMFANTSVTSGANGLKSAFTGIRDAVNTVSSVIAAMPAKWAQLQAFMAPVIIVAQTLWSTLAANLMPALQNLWATIQSQLMPAWKQLQEAIIPILPTLQFVGTLIGGVIVAAFGILIGLIVGVVSSFAGMIPGITQAFVGVVQIVSGFVQYLQGIVTFIGDLLTGHFDRLGADIGMIWGGIVRMFQGVWNVISGLFSAAIGSITGFVSGFISTIIGFFTHLYDTLIGHSIVPDMINGIINWFQGLPGKAVAALGGLVSSIGGVFTDLKNSAFTWMSDMIGNIVGGINAGVGQVKQAASNIAGVISDILHHTVPEEGPLAHDDEWMTDFGQNLVYGLNGQVTNVRAAALNVAGAIALARGDGSYTYSTIGSKSATLMASSGSSSSNGDQHIHVYIGNEQIEHYVSNRQMKNVRLQGVRG